MAQVQRAGVDCLADDDAFDAFGFGGLQLANIVQMTHAAAGNHIEAALTARSVVAARLTPVSMPSRTISVTTRRHTPISPSRFATSRIASPLSACQPCWSPGHRVIESGDDALDAKAPDSFGNQIRIGHATVPSTTRVTPSSVERNVVQRTQAAAERIGTVTVWQISRTRRRLGASGV